jgi:hypothetical protein
MAELRLVKAVDPRHGRRIPTGRRVAKALRRLFLRQRADVLAQVLRLPDRAPDIGKWSPAMTEVLTPVMLGYWRDGGDDGARSIRRAIRLHRQRHGRKDATSDAIQSAFTVFNRRVTTACQQATLLFCEETNRTSTLALDLALEAVRGELSEGLARGDALKTLTAKVQEIFADPFRAFRIATTEASRALHAGQVLLDQSTGGLVKAKKWLASSDACDKCLALDGIEVGLDEPFEYVTGRGAYSVIWHPPFHPHCMCTFTEVLDLESRLAA